MSLASEISTRVSSCNWVECSIGRRNSPVCQNPLRSPVTTGIKYSQSNDPEQSGSKVVGTILKITRQHDFDIDMAYQGYQNIDQHKLFTSLTSVPDVSRVAFDETVPS